MQQSAIKTSVSNASINANAKKSRLEVDFDRVVRKCKAAGLNMTVDFLQTKARRSFTTALNLWIGLQHLDA
jgi:hypothetical protein